MFDTLNHYPREVIQAYRPECIAALGVIFRRGQNPTKRERLCFHSYVSNLNQMIEYALDNNLDPVRYISSIKTVMNQKQR